MSKQNPPGWEMPLLGEVVRITQGNSKLTKKLFTSEGKYVAFSGSGPDGLMENYEHEGKAIILSAVGARCGKCFKADGKWTAIANTAVIRSLLDQDVLYDYFFYLLNNEDFWPKGGTAQPFVQTGLAQRKTRIPLPPLNEQRRIVAKLEKLLTKVEACQERLDKIPVLLKHFRQSVLAAACSGRLTADWRKGTPDVESAINLLSRIKEQRLSQAQNKKERTQVEEAFQELHLRAANGELECEDIPESWICCIVGAIGTVCNGSTPSRKRLDFWAGNIPWVSSGEVRNNIIRKTREKITGSGYESSSVRLLPRGTILLAMIGEGKTRGQTAILDIEATINQNIAAIILDHGLLHSEYLWRWLQLQYQETRERGSGSGPQALNCQRVRELPFVLPPLAEQQEIVRRVEALFKIVDQIEERYKKAKTHIDKLTQSILAKAFRGELVPQDPTNEPASELLRKIAGSRETFFSHGKLIRKKKRS